MIHFFGRRVSDNMFTHHLVSVFLLRLTIFHPPHIQCPFTECLTFHVDAIFTYQTVSTHTSRDTTWSGPFPVIFGVCSV